MTLPVPVGCGGPPPGIGVHLDRLRRGGEARLRESPRGRIGIRDEVRDVIEEDFITGRQPAIDAGHRAASVSLRCSVAIRIRAPRSILLVVESGRRSTNHTKRGC